MPISNLNNYNINIVKNNSVDSRNFKNINGLKLIDKNLVRFSKPADINISFSGINSIKPVKNIIDDKGSIIGKKILKTAKEATDSLKEIFAKLKKDNELPLTEKPIIAPGDNSNDTVAKVKEWNIKHPDKKIDIPSDAEIDANLSNTERMSRELNTAEAKEVAEPDKTSFKGNEDNVNHENLDQTVAENEKNLNSTDDIHDADYNHNLETDSDFHNSLDNHDLNFHSDFNHDIDSHNFNLNNHFDHDLDYDADIHDLNLDHDLEHNADIHDLDLDNHFDFGHFDFDDLDFDFSDILDHLTDWFT